MPHVITSLCLRDAGCVDVCPVEAIVPGKPEKEWPWYYIDPDTCIDCGACVAECPFDAIFTDDEIPESYEAKGGEYLSMPVGTPGFETVYDGEDSLGESVHLEATRILEAGEEVDLSAAVQKNADFFDSGPGYTVLDE